MKEHWRSWLKVAKRVADIQANIVLTIIFILFIVPVSVVIKIFIRNALYGSGHSSKYGSYWVKRDKIRQDMNWAQHQ